jgi:hypothetical protein
MTRSTRKLIIAAGAILILLGAELARESVVYFRDSRNLQHSYWKIRNGMTKEQLIAELGPPTRDTGTTNEEALVWSSREFQGQLLKIITPKRGHYEIAVTLGPDGTVTDVTSGSS